MSATSEPTEPRELVDGRVEARDRNDEGRPASARPRDRFGRPLPYGAVNEMEAREEPEDVVASIPEALGRVVELFAEERFFEAHEFLEYVWKHPELEPADRDFWKGVTQVAVGCAHTQRGNDAGAKALLERALGYMAPYPDAHGGVDAAALAAGARRVIARIEADGAAPDLDFPRFPLA